MIHNLHFVATKIWTQYETTQKFPSSEES